MTVPRLAIQQREGHSNNAAVVMLACILNLYNAGFWPWSTVGGEISGCSQSKVERTQTVLPHTRSQGNPGDTEFLVQVCFFFAACIPSHFSHDSRLHFHHPFPSLISLLSYLMFSLISTLIFLITIIKT